MIDIHDYVESELKIVRFENSIINSICDTFCHDYDVLFDGDLRNFYLKHPDRRTWFSKYIYPREPRYSMIHGWCDNVRKEITFFIKKHLYINNMVDKFQELDEKLTKLGIKKIRIRLI